VADLHDICICIYSGFDAVYQIVIIFLHMNFGVVVSLFTLAAAKGLTWKAHAYIYL
jgi:hypothetical protein